jgi:DDE_Tnp_1-associated
VVFPPLFAKVQDPRDPLKILYPLDSLAFAGVMMFLCQLKARRQIGLLLRNAASARKFQALFGVKSFPHGDTLEALFCNLTTDPIQAVVSAMTETLIRNKVLYSYRILGNYFIVAVDGTGTISFSHPHCPHCLTRTRNGKTLYYHPVLEAKLITSNGFAFSLMSEFIENPGDKVTKQDCELKAFYRLAGRLKARFPRLPILLSLDGLFAGGPTFDLCKRHGWKFMIVLKDDDLPSVNKEFDALSTLQPENRLTWRTGKGAQIKQDFRWADDLLYVDSEKKEHTLFVIECLESKLDKKAEKKTTKFKWVTNCRVSSKNVATLSNEGGRMRWKIENEGFNVQKRGGYALEHAYTNHPNSAKIFYFLLQIAHLLAQLLYKGNLLKRDFPAGFGSAKNLAFRLLEAWRNAPTTQADITSVFQKRIQIRFDSS